MQVEPAILKVDFCVLGGGSAGLSFAAGAVQMGASVILVESGAMGGDCLNVGCIPSKALIAAGKFGAEIKHAAQFGWKIVDPIVDYSQVYDHIHRVIARIAPNDSVKRFEQLGVRVINACAQFLDYKTLLAGQYKIQAKRFIIATGSKPFIPNINGLASVKYYTNQNIFDLKILPKQLVIIGGGPIGVELAQAMHNLGSKVTILEAFTALTQDDLELTSKLKQILIEQGIVIYEQAQITSIEQRGESISIKVKGDQDHELLATHLLIAAGRRANIQDLNLTAAEVEYTEYGIKIDKTLRTKNRKIYALGDCVGGLQFTHVAGYHAGIAIRNCIFKLGVKVETKAIPWVTYTDPELAHVGLTEAQALQRGLQHKVLKLDFADNDRAQTECNTDGMIKLIVTPKGRILGVSILSASAGELIYPWVIAINNKLNVGAIASSIAPYPTLNDLNKRIAGNFYVPKLFSPLTRKIVQFMLRITI